MNSVRIPKVDSFVLMGSDERYYVENSRNKLQCAGLALDRDKWEFIHYTLEGTLKQQRAVWITGSLCNTPLDSTGAITSTPRFSLY